MAAHIVECFHNPLSLAQEKLFQTRMASSYDRRGGNHDWSNYLRAEGRSAVLMEASGPGCITRFWTADPQNGVVRILIDGGPALEMPLSALFRHLPLSFGIGGESVGNYARSKAERLPMGHTSYCPMPFRRHCEITIEPEDDYLYYQVNYHLFPPGTPTGSFDPTRPPDHLEVRQAEEAWANWEQQGTLRSWTNTELQIVDAAAGESVDLVRDEGAGIIHGLRLELPAEPDPRRASHRRDNVWLVAHFDDDEPQDPSVRVPLGPFFLDYGQEPTPRSLYVGTDAEGAYYTFFAMPYASSARVRLDNRSLFPLDSVRVSLLRERLPELPSGLQRFRATWHAETPFGPDHRDYDGVACRLLNLDGRDNYELLNVRAAGHFVGCGFHVDLRDAPTDRAAGEGDEMFFIDDDPRLTMYGTGAEDYLNDAWGIRGYIGPLSGDAISGVAGADLQFSGYRLHLSDCVPFVRSGRFTLEHGAGNNCSGHYRSVAYWYMSPASARTRVEERRWQELHTRGAA